MKTITINKTAYKLKYTLRILFIFEGLTGYPFKFGKLLDEYILFYSALLANNEDFAIPFNEFIKLCDDKPSLFEEFKDFILNEIKRQEQEEVKEEDVKKKKKRK